MNVDPNTPLYTLWQLRGAYSAGKKDAFDSFEQYLEEEIDDRISDENSHELELADELEETKEQLRRCRIALDYINEDLTGRGLHLFQWIKDLI